MKIPYSAKFDIIKTFQNFSFEDIKIPASLSVEDILAADFVAKKTKSHTLWQCWCWQNSSCNSYRNQNTLHDYQFSNARRYLNVVPTNIEHLFNHIETSSVSYAFPTYYPSYLLESSVFTHHRCILSIVKSKFYLGQITLSQVALYFLM